MSIGLLGQKIGMTSVYDANGKYAITANLVDVASGAQGV